MGYWFYLKLKSHNKSEEKVIAIKSLLINRNRALHGLCFSASPLTKIGIMRTQILQEEKIFP